MDYKVANLEFKIEGKGKFYNAFVEYFKDVEIEKADNVGLIINIVENNITLPSFDRYSLSKKISFDKNGYMIKESDFVYSVLNLFDKNQPTIFNIYTKNTNGGFIKNVANKVYKSLSEVHNIGDYGKYNRFVASVANYKCLWYIFAITLLKKNCVFVHSGMMSKDNKGYCLSGTSGCGKTSTMMDLISDSGYEYIAEDFGIISADGKMYTMQKKAAIYQSDAKYKNVIIIDALKRLRNKEKAEWKFKKMLGINVRYFFKPTQLFGNDRISTGVPITRTFFISRSYKDSTIHEKRIEINEIVERIANASFREIKELFEILTNIRAVGGEEYFEYYPSISELMAQYKSILSTALKESYCSELILPEKVNPKETAKIVTGELNNDR